MKQIVALVVLEKCHGPMQEDEGQGQGPGPGRNSDTWHLRLGMLGMTERRRGEFVLDIQPLSAESMALVAHRLYRR